MVSLFKCNNCSKSFSLNYCSDCTECFNCISCNNCQIVRNSKNCSNSSELIECINCIGCTDCYECSRLVNCEHMIYTSKKTDDRYYIYNKKVSIDLFETVKYLLYPCEENKPIKISDDVIKQIEILLYAFIFKRSRVVEHVIIHPIAKEFCILFES